MYCKNCGTPISDESKFCPNCGQNLMEDPMPTENDITQSELRENEYEIVNETAAEESSCTCEPVIKEPTCTCEPAAEEESSFAQPEYTEQPIIYDPFSGPAHPSVKKNIIKACVAVGIATVISIILMTVSIVSIIKNGSLEEAFSAMNAYDENIIAEEDTPLPIELPDTNVVLGDAGNTFGNTTNDGFAVSDGNGGAYYTDINIIYYRSANNSPIPIVETNGDYCSNLNIKDNCLYYIVNADNDTKQDVMQYDMTAKKETLLSSEEETIFFMMLYGNNLYYSTESEIHMMDLSSNEISTLYSSDKAIYDLFINENGIYFSMEENSGAYWLYRINHGETTETPEEKGYYFCIDNGKLYSTGFDYTGYDTIFKRDELGGATEPVYSFEENTYITQMNIQNNTLFCITETEETDGSYTYAIRIINLESGEELVVDKDSSSEENPFFSPNVAGNYLFYYDYNFDFGIRVYEF